MDNIEIDSKEFDRWLDSTKTAVSDLNRSFGRLVIDSENEIQENMPVGASSSLSNSVPAYTEVTRRADEYRGRVGSNIDYATVAAETGRKPGSYVPAGLGTALDRWAKQKGLNAYAVAKSIKRRGTRRYREKGPKLVSQAVARIENFHVRRFVNTLVSELTK